MTTPQAPLGSGFGHQTTADEVLVGLDLTGRLAIVTGGYSGIGIETTRALAKAGARVVVPARRAEVAAAELAGIEGVEVDELDLADQASVQGFAERFLATDRAVDMMINNAGVMACPETRVENGWEAQFATNHLGHYALLNRLWPALARAAGGARVVALSSSAHALSGIRWDDVMFEREAYDPWLAYGQSKTAAVLLAVHLNSLAKSHGFQAFAVNPGGILTPLQRHMPKADMVERGWIDQEGTPLMTDVFKSPEAGAATATWAATSPQLVGLGGVYLDDVDIAAPSPDDQSPSGVHPWATDPEQAARLWALSAELTGLDALA
ncbi:oxidoreductase [Rhodococcus sp. H29-C3]|uniref:oxidoreductase n=1 Tax=Rhodococcus sp. H29-C3 TaxID=3046307 RepID=UPI0024BB3DC2|nr:oxidoreductase [Rhodococcus sp. H29-C3]MDJ0360811.1 oxidoreductase [Rhodococcus sp. H29-C3]